MCIRDRIIAIHTYSCENDSLIDLTGEESCPTSAKTEGVENLSSKSTIANLITSSPSLPPILIEDPLSRTVITRNELNQETVVLEEGIYVHYNYEGND